MANWVVDNLENALDTWNDKLAEIWTLVTQSPKEFKGGDIWDVMVEINGAVQAIGCALLVLFFVVGMVKTCGSFTEVKKPEHVLKLFVRFALAKGVITHGLELMLALFNIAQGVVATIIKSAGFDKMGKTKLPEEIVTAVEDCGFLESIPLWAVTLIGSLFITILRFVMILTVYGRFFSAVSLYSYSTDTIVILCRRTDAEYRKKFLKILCGSLSGGGNHCTVLYHFSLFASSPPEVAGGEDVAAVTMVWSYVGELVFNMLVLVGTVKMSDRVVREMMGL